MNPVPAYAIVARRQPARTFKRSTTLAPARRESDGRQCADAFSGKSSLGTIVSVKKSASKCLVQFDRSGA